MKLLDLIITTAYAQSDSSGGGLQLQNPLKATSIQGLIDNIIKQALVYVSIIVVIFIIVGAFQMIFSGGNPETFKKGQKTIVYAVIGLAIALVARGISALIEKILNG